MDRSQKAKEAFDSARDYFIKGEFEIAQNRFESLLYFYKDIYPPEQINLYINQCKNKTSPEFIIAEIEREKLEKLRREEKERKAEIKRQEELARKAEQERREKEEIRRSAFNCFSNFCDANCEIFIINEYDCNYDDMTFTARIFKKGAFSEPIVTSDSKSRISFSLTMLYNNSKCVLFPVMHFEHIRIISSIHEVYIRIGEDRYRTIIQDATNITLNGKTFDSASIILGLNDVDMLKAMVDGKQSVVKIRFGDTTASIPQITLKAISDYISVLEISGVFSQPALKSQENKFVKFTSFN